MYAVILAILLAIFIYLALSKHYNHWTSRGVKQNPQIYILGDTARFFFQKETFLELFKRLYSCFPEERYVGMYQMLRPVILMKDPELIKQIAVKDFDHFVDRMTFIPDGADELWSRNLVSLKGNRWRDMRSTMSPTFTSSRMKMIFNLISESGQEFNKYLLDLASKQEVVSLELKDLFARYTNDVIATVAFGIKCDSLRQRENEFYEMGKEATSFIGFCKAVKVIMFLMVPTICKWLKLRLIRKDAADFFKRIIKETITMREEKGITRPDALQLLMEARKGRQLQEGNEKIVDNSFAAVKESNHTSMNHKILREEITDIDITAQALIFFLGGFETVSTHMCFMGYELAVNSEIQLKLQAEIDETLAECNGVLTYEALMKMKYMDMVVSETLRKWPVQVVADRECTKPYIIQPTTPNQKSLYINKGDILVIPIGGLHYDPKYFPDPDRFDPERFSDENKNNINPYSYLPFGVGPRNCIGSRFALLETKMLFFYLLSKFDLVVTKRTQIPLKLSNKGFVMLAEDGYWVGLRLRTIVD